MLRHRPGVRGTSGRPGSFPKLYVFFSFMCLAFSLKRWRAREMLHSEVYGSTFFGLCEGAGLGGGGGEDFSVGRG